MIYIFTGKLGGGKTLCSVGRIKEKLIQKLPVVTNLDIKLFNMFNKKSKDINLIRIPDRPSRKDLDFIGNGNTSYDEEKNGLLVLDECGTWFNSRNWNDKGRKEVNDWFLHARKKGWDVILIIQNIDLLDGQARKAIAEHTVFCKRTDRILIPFIGSFIQLVFGKRLPLPRVHVAKAVYGHSPTDPVSDRWVFRGKELFQCYDTKQLFLDDYENGVHSVLPPWHTHGRHQQPLTMERLMRLTHVYLRRLKSPLALFCGAVTGCIIALFMLPFVAASEPEPLVIAPPKVVEEVVADTGSDSSSFVDGSVSSVDEDIPLTLRQIFLNYKIVGFVSNSYRQDYLISGINTGVYTDKQIQSMGYLVQPVNECELLITNPLDLSDRVPIFFYGCIAQEPTTQVNMLRDYSVLLNDVDI